MDGVEYLAATDVHKSTTAKRTGHGIGRHREERRDCDGQQAAFAGGHAGADSCGSRGEKANPGRSAQVRRHPPGYAQRFCRATRLLHPRDAEAMKTVFADSFYFFALLNSR